MASHERSYRTQVRENGSVTLTRALGWLPGIGCTVLGIELWIYTGTPVGDIVWFVAAWVWLMALPGWVLSRLLLGAHDSFVEDATCAAVIGLIAALLVWLLLTWVGLNALFVGWSIVPLALTAVPRWRRVWRWKPFPERSGFVAAWLTAAATAAALTSMATGLFARSQLPPGPNLWYQDDYWHLALAAQLRYSVPPDLPQVAGTPFWYHWFSNAHMASLTSVGLDLPVVVARLWMPPVVVAGLLMLVVVGRQVTGAFWPGALAAFAVAGSASIYPSWFALFGASAFAIHSPSQQLSIAVTLLSCSLIITLIMRRRLSPGEWAVLVVSLGASAGSKASALPVLVCALLLAVVVSVFIDRSRARALGWALLAATGTMVAALPLTSGGSAGVQLQLFSTVRAIQPWFMMLGGSTPISNDAILPGLSIAGAPLLLGLILLSYVVAYGFVWLALPLLRSNVPAWFFLGMGLAGAGAMMLLNQDGLSQVYFFSGAIVGWHLLAAMGAHWAFTRSDASHGRQVSIGAVLIGLGASGIALSVIKTAFPRPGSSAGINSSISAALACWLGLLLAVTVVVLVWRGARPALWLGLVASQFGAALPLANLVPQWASAALAIYISACVLGAVLVVLHSTRKPLRAAWLLPAVLATSVVASTWMGVTTTREVFSRPLTKSNRTVTAAETSAALWLRDHSAPTDVIATNVHCVMKKTTRNCDARAFWVGAFTERRVLIEGWGYTTEAHQAHGTDGLPFARQPFHDSELFALNERVFRSPTRQDIEALRAEGVVWLFADTLAGPVSAQLRQLATPVHQTDDVVIYRLR